MPDEKGFEPSGKTMTMRLYFITVLFFFCPALLSGGEGDWRGFVGPDRLALLDSVKTAPATFYVSPDGCDGWSGRLAAPNAEKTDGPLRTFEEARGAVRRYRESAGFDGTPTVVEILPGLYEREEALELTGADSGTAASPVIWRGVCDEHGRPLAVIRGGKGITGGACAEDPEALRRLKPEMRGKVLEYDLKALGIADFGTLDGENFAELFSDGEPMTIARCPNEGYLEISGVDEEGNREIIDQGNRGVAVPKLFADGCDPAPWTAEPEIWAFGYWFWDWASGRQKIKRIDPEKKMIELDPPYHSFGYRPGKYFYVYHALCELDAPGEYYIDGGSGKLFFCPPEGAGEKPLFLSTAASFLKGSGLSHIAFSGLCFEGCWREGIALSGSDILLCGCLIRGTGGDAVRAAGDRLLLFGNLLYNIGGHGFVVDSGNQPDLIPGGSAVVNNDFHHFARIQRVYAPAVRLSGCGDLIAQNRISDAPHSGILFSGNEQWIERNEIYGVCRESNDVGAIYTGGNWTMRGNVIRQNYLHDMNGYQGYCCVGVYLDDMFSSADITENFFRNVKIPVMIGGGRDNRVVNNLFADCRWCIDLDARALDWAHRAADMWQEEIREKGTISGVDYRSPKWAERYPSLAAITEGNPPAPEGNLIQRNVVVKTGAEESDPVPFEGDRIRDEARPFITVRDNFRGDERLFEKVMRNQRTVLPGGAEFRRIPVEKIGVFRDANAIAR